MAHIKAIRFESVGRKEGCTCDRCDQYIRGEVDPDGCEKYEEVKQ